MRSGENNYRALGASDKLLGETAEEGTLTIQESIFQTKTDTRSSGSGVVALPGSPVVTNARVMLNNDEEKEPSTMTLAPQALLGLRVDHLRDQLIGLLSELEAINRLEALQVDRGIDLKSQVRKFEIGLIESALSIAGGSQVRAAGLLNVKLTTLNSKIKLYRISCRKSVISQQES